jgi:hypothetical protein
LNLAFVGRFKDELDDVEGPRWTISYRDTRAPRARRRDDVFGAVLPSGGG